MFVVISKLFDVLLGPVAWSLMLSLLGLARLRADPQRRRGRRLLLAGVLVLWAGALPPVAALLTSVVERGEDTVRPDVTYDVVVLLGGMFDVDAHVDSGRSAYSDAVDRLIETHRVLREGRARFALVSGGNVRGDGPPEAPYLAEQLIAWGIAPERIHFEGRSRNTHENAVESAAVIRERGWRDVLLVTSAAHMPRALGCFRAVGLSPDTLRTDPHGTRVRWEFGALLPRADALARTTSLLRELAGRSVYRLRGWTKPAG